MKNVFSLIFPLVLLACQKPIAGVGQSPEKQAKATKTMSDSSQENASGKEVVKSDEQWKKQLSPEQYRVLREAGTEAPFGKAYETFKAEGEGTYVCAACNSELFRSKEKFDSHCGWPSFYDAANAKNVIIRADLSGGMQREEVICATCKGHLGHIFRGENYKTPTNQRYCINGVSLKFVPDKK